MEGYTQNEYHNFIDDDDDDPEEEDDEILKPKKKIKYSTILKEEEFIEE
jgi:hypothetical protein